MKSLFILILITLSLNIHAENEYKIWWGIFNDKTNDIENLQLKTNSNIPLITEKMDPCFSFGFMVHCEKCEEFTLHYHAVIPKTKTVGFNEKNHKRIDYDVEFNKNSVIINTPKTICKKTCFKKLRFDKDDQPGLYSFDVYVNDKLQKNIIFNVQTHK